jgi:hypothetical protein
VTFISSLLKFLKINQVLVPKHFNDDILLLSDKLDELLIEKKFMQHQLEEAEKQHRASSAKTKLDQTHTASSAHRPTHDLNTTIKDITIISDRSAHIDQIAINAIIGIMQHDLLLPVIDKQIDGFDKDIIKIFSHFYENKSLLASDEKLTAYIDDFKIWASHHFSPLIHLQTSLDLAEAIGNIIFSYAQTHKLERHSPLAEGELRLERLLPSCIHCDPRITQLSNIIALLNNLDGFTISVQKLFESESSKDHKTIVDAHK